MEGEEMGNKVLGFIGLGHMGLPMSTALVDAGYEVYGTDVNEEAEKQFVKTGGKIGLSIAEMAKKVDIIMTSLPTPEIVEDVLLRDEGIVKHAQPDLLMIDFSTVSPKVNDGIAEAAKDNRIGYLGVPVSGGIIGAKKQTLSIMVGGEKNLYEEAYPIFEIVGENIFHISEKPGAGTIV